MNTFESSMKVLQKICLINNSMYIFSDCVLIKENLFRCIVQRCFQKIAHYEFGGLSTLSSIIDVTN